MLFYLFPPFYGETVDLNVFEYHQLHVEPKKRPIKLANLFNLEQGLKSALSKTVD